MKTKIRYVIRRTRRDLRAVGFRGVIVALFCLVMVAAPIDGIHKLHRGTPLMEVVIDCWTNIVSTLIGYTMILLGATLLSQWQRFRTYMHWHIQFRVREENAKLEQMRLGYEEQLMAKIIKAKRELEEERRSEGEGWKNGGT